MYPTTNAINYEPYYTPQFQQYTDPNTGQLLSVTVNEFGQPITFVHPQQAQPPPSNLPNHHVQFITTLPFLQAPAQPIQYLEPRFLPYDHEERLYQDNPLPPAQEYGQLFMPQPIGTYENVDGANVPYSFGGMEAQASSENVEVQTYVPTGFLATYYPEYEYPGDVPYNEVSSANKDSPYPVHKTFDSMFGPIIAEQEKLHKLMNIEIEAQMLAAEEAKKAAKDKKKALDKPSELKEEAISIPWSCELDGGDDYESDWGGHNAIGWPIGNFKEYSEMDFPSVKLKPAQDEDASNMKIGGYQCASMNELAKDEICLDRKGCAIGSRATGDGFVDISLSEDEVRVFKSRNDADLTFTSEKSLFRYLCHGMHRKLSFVLPSCMKKQRKKNLFEEMRQLRKLIKKK